MKIKYLVPLILLVVGFLLSSIQAYLLYQSNINSMIEKAIKETRIIGHRLTVEIEKQNLIDKKNRQELLRLISLYSADKLNKIIVFDKNREVLYKSIPTIILQNSYEKNLLNEAIDNYKTDTRFHKETQIIDLFAPLVFYNNDDGKILNQDVGALYVEFDYSEDYQKIKEYTVKNLLINGLIVFIIVGFLHFILEIMIFRRLKKLYNFVNGSNPHETNKAYANRNLDEIGVLAISLYKSYTKIKLYNKKMEKKVAHEIKIRMEQQSAMIHQNRLAAMGEMLSMIAHQWRQPLNEISLTIQMIEHKYKIDKLDKPLLSQYSDNLSNVIEKMSDTIDDFMYFFKPNSKKKSFNIYKSISHTISLVDVSMEYLKIELTTSIDKNLYAYGYESEFSQVILNLINNAKDYNGLKKSDINSRRFIS